MLCVKLYAERAGAGEPLHNAAYRLLERAAAERGHPLPLRVEALPGGKPHCPEIPGFHFNLSHSDGWAVCAVGGCPVGVDIQGERRLRASVVRRFSPWEQEQLAHLPPEGFFDLWALKEAAAKCTGRCGMSGVLHGSEVTLSPVSVGIPGIRAALIPFPEAGLHLAVAAAAEEAVSVCLCIGDGRRYFSMT